MIDVSVSLSLKGSPVQRAKVPKMMKISNLPGKSDMPFSDFIYVTITTTDLSFSDIMLYITAQAKTNTIVHSTKPAAVIEKPE